MSKILLIDDDRSFLQLMSQMVSSMGFDCTPVTDAVTGLELLKGDDYSAVITDFLMPGLDGLTVLKESLKIDRTLQVILVTALSELAPAVEAIKSGAADYIQKPLNKDQLQAALVKAMDKKKLLDENQNLKDKLASVYHYKDIIGRSEAMLNIFKTVERIASTNAAVLIHGESGTGKELVARAIHQSGSRSNSPFVGVDCVAIPKELLESELFGYEKSAFTGALNRREGLLHEAQGGTFFLDEVTEIDYGLQAKLLRVLQERKYRRVGGRDLLDLDLRVVAATRRDPLKAVGEGVFREDLYYRLNVIPVEIPPLRERREDIPLLIEFFTSEYEEEYGESTAIDPDAMYLLQTYSWPGNVSELRNVLTRLCIMSAGVEIKPSDLPENIVNYASKSPGFEWLANLNFKEAKEKWLEGFEVKYVNHLLSRYNGNVSEAARNSGINRKTLQRLIKKHHISKGFSAGE